MSDQQAQELTPAEREALDRIIGPPITLRAMGTGGVHRWVVVNGAPMPDQVRAGTEISFPPRAARLPERPDEKVWLEVTDADREKGEAWATTLGVPVSVTKVWKTEGTGYLLDAEGRVLLKIDLGALPERPDEGEVEAVARAAEAVLDSWEIPDYRLPEHVLEARKAAAALRAAIAALAGEAGPPMNFENAQEVAEPMDYSPVASRPADEDGNGPCADCGRSDYTGLGGAYWFADNDLWNEVVDDERQLMLCPSCFVARAKAKGVGVGFRAGRVGEIDVP